ncbi:hypothetical protein Q7P37_008630 [Cladosporium fusiforme]
MPYATVNDHPIHFFDSNALHEIQNERPPIMMIHGLGSSQNYWMPVISQIASKHRCIALDNYGAGRSKSKGEKVTLEGLADDVVGLMDCLNISKAVIAGHSMGGTMTCIIAAKYPGRVAGIVPVGPVNPGSVKPEAFTSRIETVLKDGMEPMANTIPKAATSSQASDLTRGFIRELILGSEPKGYASHCQAIVDVQAPDFAAIQTPVCILAGDEDKSAPLEGCKYIHEHAGSSRKDLKVLEACGHWHCVEHPERVAKEIDSFCSSL